MDPRYQLPYFVDPPFRAVMHQAVSAVWVGQKKQDDPCTPGTMGLQRIDSELSRFPVPHS